MAFISTFQGSVSPHVLLFCSQVNGQVSGKGFFALCKHAKNKVWQFCVPHHNCSHVARGIDAFGTRAHSVEARL